MDLIKKIHHYLFNEIEEMNKVVVNSLAVEENLIQIMSNYLSNAGGKRIRPILIILSAKMFGYKGDQSIKLAAAIEFIHMATLLHDDVVDGSKMRRFLPTANVVWGSKASILVGDFLFSQSFKLIVSTESMIAMKTLADAAAIIIEGEVTQLTKLEQKRIVSEDEYLKVIKAKTAELFGAACAVGAIIARREDKVDVMKNFGLQLGNIFQISDDALDYFSDYRKVGKNIGDDFYEGKVTLPIILLAKALSNIDRIKLKLMFEVSRRSKTDFNWVKEQMVTHKIDQIILQYTNNLKNKLLILLDQIPVIEEESKQYMRNLVEFAINRTH